MTHASLRCRLCERTQPLAPGSTCPDCGGPLDVVYDLRCTSLVPDGAAAPRSMWRYRDLLPYTPADTSAPGMTPLVEAPRLSHELGVEVLLKLEDENPTHSFKDRVAASAVAAAEAFGLETICCASTGNLGDAVAAACASAGLEAVVLLPAGHSPPRRARAVGVAATIDECRELERRLAYYFPWGFVEGNLHVVAAEGAKTIAFEVAEQLGGVLPDAVVSPVASGTLFAKLGQGFSELQALGAVLGPTPRLYGAQAGGCPPLAAAWADDRPPSKVRPETEVPSLAVGDPAYGELAFGAARMSGGSIRAVPEEDIAEHTALLARVTDVHADSAGGVALGALVELVRTGEVAEGERVVLVVTGTGLKPERFERRRPAHEADGSVDSVLAALGVAG